MSARLGALAALMLAAALVAAGLAWRGSERMPDAVADAAAQAARLPGVVAVDLERSDHPEPARRWFGPDPSRIDVTVLLAGTLTPADAAVTAKRVGAVFAPAAEEVAAQAVSLDLRVTAGEPHLVGGSARYPVDVPHTAGLAADVADAFTLWRAGAERVQVYGIGAPVGGASAEGAADGLVWPEPAAAVGVEARDPATLVELAALALELGRAADLRSSDGSVSFESYGSVPDVEAVALAVAAAARPAVESAIFSNSTAPTLFVYTAGPVDSPETRELRSWIEAHTYATETGRRAAFVISEPGFANRSEGWVSALGP